MEIDKKYKLEKCVSKDPMRASLQNIFVHERHAFATNGHFLAVVPTRFEKEDSIGWLSPDALKLARKLAPKVSDTVHIELNGFQKLPDGTIMSRPSDEEKPPRLFSILRDARTNRKYKIGLNAAYLRDLAEALGNDELILEFGDPDKPIQITPVHAEPGTIGLLMPIRLNP
jgi:DNA polymerase III sliding clamp (beta) subunit (PCNA family)